MADLVPPTTEVNIKFVRNELSKVLSRYTVIRDVIEQRVADMGEVYLPDPSGKLFADRTNDEKQRYANYSLRAIFYNFVGRTLTGFVGQIFSRDAEVTVPPRLEALIKDATGDGLTLEQLAKDACAEVLSVGRYGLFIDYPDVLEPATVEQVDKGLIRPTIVPYLGEKIINWNTRKINGLNVLSFVVLQEKYFFNDDPYNPEFKDQWRVLELDENNLYRMRVYREDGGFGDRDVYPKANGEQMDFIPFTFVGAVNNDPCPDLPPMYDMAKINIGHYRNSADNEESIFYSGQPTFVVTGMQESWLNKVLGGVIRFGSRFGLALEKNSDAKIIQATPNSVVREGMIDKQEQLASMGAEFLKGQSVAKTATEAAIDDSSRTSSISNAAKNVSAAFQFALECAAVFQGVPEEKIVFKLNSEFDLTRMSDSERAQLIKEEQADLISWTEARSALHKAGIATQTDEVAKKEIDEKQAKQIETAAKEFAATTVVDPAKPVAVPAGQ